MTTISISLTFLGLVALFWPLATLLFKRQVLDAQWLMMLAMSMLGMSFILLGCLFNTFLKDDYLLLMLYLIDLILTPPVIHIARRVLTHERQSLSSRAIFIPSLLYVVVMIFSVVVAGVDVYQLWASRGLEGLTGVFYPNSWRYNLIVAVHFYLFWTLFTVEVLFIFINSIRQFVHLKRVNSEYYTSDRFHNINLKGIFWAVNIGTIILFASFFTNPFAEDHTVAFHMIFIVPLSVIILYIGRNIFMINNGAERLHSNISKRKNPALQGRLLEDFVEKEKAFLNPDISVFLLAEHLHTSEDDIIDLIHRRQGTSFGGYIDNLRIEYATHLIVNGRQLSLNDADDMNRFAHECGYLSVVDLQRSFQSVMQTSLANWYEAR